MLDFRDKVQKTDTLIITESKSNSDWEDLLLIAGPLQSFVHEYEQLTLFTIIIFTGFS